MAEPIHGGSCLQLWPWGSACSSGNGGVLAAPYAWHDFAKSISLGFLRAKTYTQLRGYVPSFLYGRGYVYHFHGQSSKQLLNAKVEPRRQRMRLLALQDWLNPSMGELLAALAMGEYLQLPMPGVIL